MNDNRGIVFVIEKKTVGKLELIPQPDGLRLRYTPPVDDPGKQEEMDILLPLDEVGEFWATARTFQYRGLATDVKILVNDGSTLISLSRQSLGADMNINEAKVYLRLRPMHQQDPSRQQDPPRFLLGDRDLVSLDLAFMNVMFCSQQMGLDVLGIDQFGDYR